jgi:hypothetical protein
LSPRYRPLAGVTQELVGQELFIYGGPRPDAVHCLNSGAAIIWYLCDGTRDVDEVVNELAAQYGLLPAEAERDVRETVARLQALHLLVEEF